MRYSLLLHIFFIFVVPPNSVEGCISTGKEANVYYASKAARQEGEAGESLAIKVYKTSILVFKACGDIDTNLGL